MKRTLAVTAIVGLALALLPPAAAAQDPGKEVLKIQLPGRCSSARPRTSAPPISRRSPASPAGRSWSPPGPSCSRPASPSPRATSEPVIGEVACVTDGKKSGEDGYYVELGPMLQWVQIDLGKSQELQAIVAWHYHSQARVYRDVVVQVSDDKDFIGGVTTVFNNDHDNTSGLGAGRDKEYIETFDGKLFDPKGVKARYVRLYSGGNTSNDMNHYVEVEVYGLPAK
ncbi:MAG: discoidin domain-containing protein [Ignavibacteriales bacterium]|nr:discoidin domain-containing protein [Ignavibacteriales bacterium]